MPLRVAEGTERGSPRFPEECRPLGPGRGARACLGCPGTHPIHAPAGHRADGGHRRQGRLQLAHRHRGAGTRPRKTRLDHPVQRRFPRPAAALQAGPAHRRRHLQRHRPRRTGALARPVPARRRGRGRRGTHAAGPRTRPSPRGLHADAGGTALLPHARARRRQPCARALHRPGRPRLHRTEARTRRLRPRSVPDIEGVPALPHAHGQRHPVHGAGGHGAAVGDDRRQRRPRRRQTAAGLRTGLRCVRDQRQVAGTRRTDPRQARRARLAARRQRQRHRQPQPRAARPCLQGHRAGRLPGATSGRGSGVVDGRR